MNDFKFSIPALKGVLTLSLIMVSCSHGLAAKPGIHSANKKLATLVVSEHVKLISMSYADAINGAKDLQSAVKKFTANPNKQNQDAAKESWKLARKSYSKTEAFRFYGGPIDDPQKGPEGLLNAWPLDEAYIDYVKDGPKAGIIQNPEQFPSINRDLLLSLNEKDGEKNISTGYHAVEFLLWGQDFSTTSPGTRSYKDYDPAANKFAERRSIYINLLCDLIVEHLEQVASQWSSKTKNSYQRVFLKQPTSEALQKIFTGLVTLSVDEMAGERITVALELNDQENEQNCFSDYSLEDSHHNQAGIRSVLTYSNDTPSLLDLIKAQNAEHAKAILTALDRVDQLHKEAIAIGPFDKIIANQSEKSNGRKKLRELTAALEEQGMAIAKAGKEMGLKLNLETGSKE
jgi:putative iron-regulated protein